VGTTTYQYDPANRLSSVNGQTYTWDNNGNLLNDGSALYRYDRANRLISTTLNSTTSLFNYNGDGVRLKQIVAGVVTTYTQDLAAPLPIVLQSKTGVTTTKYLYSMGTRPLAQSSAAWEYLLPDALGSVRQIANANGYIIRTQDYEPYGSMLSSSGSGQSVYGFTGEERDQSGLIFLRARYLQPRLGIFLSRDPWSGDQLRPGSMNGYSYVEGDPIDQADPTGRIAEGQEAQDALKLIKRLRLDYHIFIAKDFGRGVFGTWNPGNWRKLDELRAVEAVVQRYANAPGSQAVARTALEGVQIKRISSGITVKVSNRPVVEIADHEFDQPGGGPLQKLWGPQVAIAHEFAHYWDWKTGDFFSRLLGKAGAIVGSMSCSISGEDGPTWYARTYGPVEDWAESVAGYLYPEYFDFLRTEKPSEVLIGHSFTQGVHKDFPLPGLGPQHYDFVNEQFRSLGGGK
jgi:RHS repeat-associated protein